MLVWQVGAVVSVAGAVGGVVSAVLSEDRGFVWPRVLRVPDGCSVLRPGFLGHILVGAVAAGISWGLYGPLTDEAVLGYNADGTLPSDRFGVTAAALAAAAGVGTGGARWLGTYVDKRLLQVTAATAAAKAADAGAAERLAVAAPTAALEIARRMPA